jgi:hypothetical protein
MHLPNRYVNRDAIPSKLKSRVEYPSVDHHLFGQYDDDEHDLEGFGIEEARSNKSQVDEEVEKEAMFELNKSFLSNVVTHVIIVKNKQLHQKLEKDFANFATRAILFGNGRPALIEPGIDGMILNNAARGTPIVVLNYTGAAAEKFSDAIIARREGKEKQDIPGRYRLPDSVSGDSCLVLDSSSDSVEKVIDKLTLVLSSVQDDEMREVGNNKSEKERLLHAWTMYTTFTKNSSIQLKRAWALHLLLILSNILTTAFALIYWGTSEECSGEAAFDMPSWLDRETLISILPMLPVLSGMLLTIQSKFSPILKWSTLYSGAEKIKSEIYMYRAR